MPDQPSYNEHELLLQIAAGDEKALKRLVDAYWPKVYYHALSFVKLPETAEEITQDIFIKIWKQRDQLGAVNSLADFIFILGRNQIISSMRKKVLQIAAGDYAHPVEDVWVPDMQAEYKNLVDRIEQGLTLLNPQPRQVFRLSRIEGLSLDEIAERLGVSKHTVKSHLTVALNFLRIYLREYRGELPLLTVALFLAP